MARFDLERSTTCASHLSCFRWFATELSRPLGAPRVM